MGGNKTVTATLSSILAWRILCPYRGAGGLQSAGSQSRTRLNDCTLQPQGQFSLDTLWRTKEWFSPPSSQRDHSLTGLQGSTGGEIPALCQPCGAINSRLHDRTPPPCIWNLNSQCDRKLSLEVHHLQTAGNRAFCISTPSEES